MTNARRFRTYWRPGGVWHRWRLWAGRAVSSCNRETRKRIGAPDRRWVRPPAMLRCAGCDLAEIYEHGADESLPEKPQPAARRHQGG